MEQSQVLEWFCSSEFSPAEQQKVWASFFFKAPDLGPKEIVKSREDTYGHSSTITSANCPESFL